MVSLIFPFHVLLGRNLFRRILRAGGYVSVLFEKCNIQIHLGILFAHTPFFMILEITDIQP